MFDCGGGGLIQIGPIHLLIEMAGSCCRLHSATEAGKHQPIEELFDFLHSDRAWPYVYA